MDFIVYIVTHKMSGEDGNGEYIGVYGTEREAEAAIQKHTAKIEEDGDEIDVAYYQDHYEYLIIDEPITLEARYRDE